MRRWRHVFIGTGSIKSNASLIRAVNLAVELTQLGVESHIILRRSADTEAYVRPHGLSVFWVEGRFECPQLPRFEGPTVFHVINPTALGVLVFFKNRRSTDRLLSDWDEYPSRTSISWRRRAEFFLLEHLHVRLADLFVFSSSYLTGQMAALVRGRAAAYIPYGYRHQPEAPEIDTGAIEGRRWVVYVGSFLPNYRRDILEILDLARAVGNREVRVLAIGDGPVLPELKEALQEGGLESAVTFLGYKPMAEMEAYLRHKSIAACFLPLALTVANLSRCPNKLFQYMAANKPVICPEIGEPARVLGAAGCYYRSGDDRSLAAALDKALAGPVSYDLAQISWRHRATQLMRFIDSNIVSQRGEI